MGKRAGREGGEEVLSVVARAFGGGPRGRVHPRAATPSRDRARRTRCKCTRTLPGPSASGADE